MKKIEKSKRIAVPKEKVWTVLLEEEYARAWYSEFMEGTHAETDWIVGHSVKFLDANDNGLVGTIVTKQPYDLIEIEFEGMVKDGETDMESEDARKVAGVREIYRLTEEDGETVLDIEFEADEAMYEETSASWDRALDKIAELSLAV